MKIEPGTMYFDGTLEAKSRRESDVVTRRLRPFRRRSLLLVIYHNPRTLLSCSLA